MEVKVGVKRPAEVEYRVEEKYVLIESEDKENRTEEKNEPQLNSFKTKDLQNTNIIEIEESKFDDYLPPVPVEDEEKFSSMVVPLKNKEKEIKAEKKNEENENDEEIEKNLNKLLDGEEENFTNNIIKNLRLVKKQKNEKREEMLLEKDVHKEDENQEKQKSEENMHIDFNWKKKKLY